MIKCCFCSSNDISQHKEIEIYQHNLLIYEVLIASTTCNHCNEEFITSDQIEKNEIQIHKAKKALIIEVPQQ